MSFSNHFLFYSKLRKMQAKSAVKTAFAKIFKSGLKKPGKKSTFYVRGGLDSEGDDNCYLYPIVPTIAVLMDDKAANPDRAGYDSVSGEVLCPQRTS